MRLETERQKAAINLSQYDAICRWQFATSCRVLPILNPFAAFGFEANSPIWDHSIGILIGWLIVGRPTPTENRSFSDYARCGMKNRVEMR